jgi:hypothetical protein
VEIGKDGIADVGIVRAVDNALAGYALGSRR